MTRSRLVGAFLLALAGALIATNSLQAKEVKRPNVLWIYLEDVSRWFGCYGDELASTPHMDALAKSGIRFDRFYTSAGVCSAMRSGTITGMMQTSINAHQHRSHRGARIGEYVDSWELPNGIQTIPEYFKAAGYWTFNDGKDDFNFAWSKQAMYDSYGAMNFQGNEWDKCPEDKPFFGQIQLRGGKDRPRLSQSQMTALDDVPVPPYYPDIKEVREQIAHHYNCIRWTDMQVGEIMAKLKEDGLLENTYIFLMSDHGYKLHRDKQYLYEGGINMAFMISGPGIKPGQVRDDLTSSIDIGPTSLAVAGITIPDHMEGKHILAKDYEPRSFVVSARDRCDYTIEHIRAIVTPKFKYLKNYLPERPYMQPSYKDPWAVSRKFRQLMASGEITDLPGGFFKDKKPVEELYDLASDPHEVKNLANDPAFKAELERHRKLLSGWIKKTDDKGMYPEKDAALLAVLKQWRDKCVNPEYDRVRNLVELPARQPKKKKSKGKNKKSK